MTEEEYNKKLDKFQGDMKQIIATNHSVAKDYALAAVMGKPSDKEKNEKDARYWMTKATQCEENLKLFENIMWRE